MAPASIPLPYQLFFLWIEPFSTIVGFYFAWFQPNYYLQLTDAKSAPGILGVPVGTEVVLRQLANLYLAFTLNEALVLRATTDLRVWRTLLFGLLVADFGHIFSVYPLGLKIYYDVANWNSIDWGNLGFVYLGATMRTCFLLGIGLGGPKKAKARAKKMVKATAEDVGIVSPARSERDPSSTPGKTPRQRRKSTKSG